jgi:uncharacterized protein (DUF433 family)
MPTVAYAHIEFAPDGTAYIARTETKVEEVVLDHLAHSWDAAEIHRQHPHLTLAEIYSALAYYYDHQEQMDLAIKEGLRQVMEIEARMPPSPVQAKLRAKGLLP